MPLGALVSSGIGAAVSADAASRSRKWARKNYRHRFQWSMQDMREAGLNPILAAGGGLGGSGGMGNVPPAQVPDIGRNVTAAKQVGNQKDLWKKQADLLVEQTAKTVQETKNLGQQQPMNIFMKFLEDMFAKPADEGIRGDIGSGKNTFRGDQSHELLLRKLKGLSKSGLKSLLRRFNETQKWSNTQ